MALKKKVLLKCSNSGISIGIVIMSNVGFSAGRVIFVFVTTFRPALELNRYPAERSPGSFSKNTMAGTKR